MTATRKIIALYNGAEMVPGGAAGEKGADKKTPDKGGNRASKTQKHIEGAYLFERIRLDTFLNLQNVG
jgi:hypothetical protein